jgi:threonine/homoserine/homoserine lactone efflux protein
VPAYLVLGFVLAVLPLIAMPGASLTLLAARVVRDGARPAGPVILGTVAGLYVHAMLAAAGLSALVLHSSVAFMIFRYAGAAYLIGLGIWTWRGHRRSGGPGRHRRRPGTGRSTALQALLGNVLNPKAASIFLTLVPQFVDPGRPVLPQILILASAQGALVTVWLLGWTVVLSRARGAAGPARWAPIVRRLAGGLLMVLGVRAAAAA